MKRIRLIFPALAGVLVLLLAACNGGSPAATPTPSPGPACAATLQSQLLYPNPAGTPAPDALAQIVIAVSSPLSNNEFNLVLTSSAGTGATANYLGQITASQLPPGSAAATIPNPIYESVNLVAALNAATQYAVAVNDTFSTCTPNTVPGGTFSTQ